MIAIITGLKAGFAERNIFSAQPVAACSCDTIAAACIGFDRIGVVAFFNAEVDHAVATARQLANADASIGLDFITIITGFNTGPGMPITTTRGATAIETSVGLHRVAIIAFFDIDLGDPVTATRLKTTVGAGIARFLIAIIAAFACIDAAVATGFQLTGHIAAVAGIDVAVIARFARVLAAVAAEVLHPAGADVVKPRTHEIRDNKNFAKISLVEARFWEKN